MSKATVIRGLSGVLFLLTAMSAAVSGELRVVGTGDGLQMLRAVAAAFSEQTPGIDAVVPDSIGSGGGIAAVSAGTERLARVARPLKDSERAAGLAYVPIARIPAVFFVHRSAGVANLRSDQVARIYSGQIKKWSEVGGRDIKIRVVRREDGDSTLQVLRRSMPGWAALEFTARSKMAVTTQDAVSTVRSVEGAIGFGPQSEALSDDTMVLAIDGRAPSDPGYPSAVELALVYRESNGGADIHQFVDFAFSDTARKILVSHGAIPVPRSG
jgi:phosphate transport system substrate-binding protein